MKWTWSKQHKLFVGIALLSLFHLIGLIGLQTIYANKFAALTSLNLFFAFILVLLFAEFWHKNLGIFLMLSFIIGMLVELVGVHTGFPFGEYYYTDKLHLLVWGVPIIIGLNWFLLSYAILSLFNTYFKSLTYWLKVGLSALLMTAVDWLIEPFAIHNALWLWTSERVPYENYLSWFIISGFLFALAYKLLPEEKNFLALSLVFILIIFFGMNNLFYLVF
ncbi:MAG: carotenoid biosynthesis protein [Chitinophagales bacterium]|nr:carotenoid biosynthesis protein [Chitinophagales bacterium]